MGTQLECGKTSGCVEKRVGALKRELACGQRVGVMKQELVCGKESWCVGTRVGVHIKHEVVRNIMDCSICMFLLMK